MPRMPTLADVAVAAGVSPATASRALNGDGRGAGPRVRERVLAAARRLDYSADARAQAMARGTTNVVGLLVHDIADPYFAAIATGVMTAAERHGLLVIVFAATAGHAEEARHLATIRGQRGRAAILAGSPAGPTDPALRREVEEFRRGGGQVVSIGRRGVPMDTVLVDNRAAAGRLAQAMAGRGHRRFGVLAGPPGLATAADRVRGFRDGLAKERLGAPAVVAGAFTRDGGYEAMAELIARKVRLDCVFAVNDVMAVGALSACRDQGIGAPALAGFDDVDGLQDVAPRLSTVRLPLRRIGAAALDLVVSASRDAAPRVRRIKGEVVLRG